MGGEFENTVGSWDAKEGLNAVRFSFFDSMAVVEVEFFGAGEPDDRRRGEGFSRKGVGGGEGGG